MAAATVQRVIDTAARVSQSAFLRKRLLNPPITIGNDEKSTRADMINRVMLYLCGESMLLRKDGTGTS